MNGAIHEECIENTHGKFVGFNHSNGKTDKIYKRYRCRHCGKYIKAEDLHESAKATLDDFILNDVTKKQFIEVLNEVWRKNENNQATEKALLTREINTLDDELNGLAENMLKPENSYIKERLKTLYKSKEAQLDKTRVRLNNLSEVLSEGKLKFIEYALGFANGLATRYFDDLSVEKREVCKQILFPGGFFINNNEEVYTPNISPIYRYASIKKDLLFTEKSLMVRVRRL